MSVALVSFDETQMSVCILLCHSSSVLLQVDQPGSLIDTYVEKLELIIQEKSKGIQDLRHLLNSFKGRLQQEEVFSKSMGKSKRKGVLK